VRGSTSLRRGLAAVGIAAAVTFVIARALDLHALGLVTKPAPVLVLAALVACDARDRDARWIAGGLVLSAVGDLLLELGDRAFLVGIAAFFAAHIAYITAFIKRRRALLPLRALPFVIYGGAVFIALQPRLAALQAPVALYTAAICLMGWRALALLGDGPRQDRLAAAGALAFIASDTILAFNRFYAPITGASGAIMGLYWLGQLGIAAASWRRPRPS
jgi:alkenylglycerophosphocholine/alkenylglycerophosphoethanolamine hydrolase